jgi:hypothetical protein
VSDQAQTYWEIQGLVDPEDPYAPGTPVISRDGKTTGHLTGSRRPCQMESCRGERLGVRWPPDPGSGRNRVTYPCTQGMVFGDGGWQIA